MQRCQAELILSWCVWALLNEHPCEFHMTSFRRQMQRCRALVVLGCRVGAMQRRRPLIVLGCRAGTFFDEEPCYFRLTSFGRSM